MILLKTPEAAGLLRAMDLPSLNLSCSNRVERRIGQSLVLYLAEDRSDGCAAIFVRSDSKSIDLYIYLCEL